MSIESDTVSSDLCLPSLGVLVNGAPPVNRCDEQPKRIKDAVWVPNANHLEVIVCRKVGCRCIEAVREHRKLIRNHDHAWGFEADLGGGFCIMPFPTCNQGESR